MSNSDSRRYPARPVLGVGALIFEGDSVLLVQRGNPPLLGMWSLPGGAVETGERLAEAVCREVLEETHLTVEAVEIAEVFERIMHDDSGAPEYHYVLVDYLCRIVHGEPRPGSDSAAVAWVRVEDLPVFPQLTEGTLAVVQRAWQRFGFDAAVSRE